MDGLDEILFQITELSEDRRVPRNVRVSVERVLGDLQNPETSITVKLNGAISVLDEVCNDTNIKPFTRTQIWNLVTILEEFQSELD
ncbi:MAG: UPF0147 family protein [DPANN group archaeon]|nr:UPF0147 family protein [DPANN group archaeon]